MAIWIQKIETGNNTLMKIRVLGAAGGEVTGSAYVLETRKARVLVDCGMFQGGRKSENLNRPPARVRGRLDAVVVTHAHLDHTGRLPLLSKIGYDGPVFATPATIEMASLILRDSARIQEGDAERRNRKRQRAGEPPVEPLYTPNDAEGIIRCFVQAPYDEAIDVAPGIRAVWAEAGHMLGSASIQLIVEEGGTKKRIVFSGDLGPRTAPILQEYEPFRTADVLFMESTYGSHDHRPFRETVDEFVQIIQEAVERRGKILVPTFAVGRAQLLTLLLAEMFRKRQVEPFPLFLDSPMAIEALKIYSEHRELFDEDMMAFLREKPMREDLKSLKLSVTADDSRAINKVTGPCLVMAGAGMCNAGRILHHLKQSLWKKSTHVMIVGYQGHGSLGRRLVDGEKSVKIHGEKIAVNAKIHTLGGFSAHAGKTDLLNWYGAIADSKPRVFLVHGENSRREQLAAHLKGQFGVDAQLPGLRDEIEV